MASTFRSLALSRTGACFLLEMTSTTSARGEFSKYLIIFSALEPVPEAKMTILFFIWMKVGWVFFIFKSLQKYHSESYYSNKIVILVFYLITALCLHFRD